MYIIIQHTLYYTNRDLTAVTLRIMHSQSKHGEEDNKCHIHKEIGEVAPGTEPVPLLVKEAGDQWVFEELTAALLSLWRGQGTVVCTSFSTCWMSTCLLSMFLLHQPMTL